MSAARFDVGAYTRTTTGRMRGALHVADYAPLDEATKRTLAYLARRTGEITDWLRLVLVTATHKEARVTAFLSTWAVERHWMADALDAMSDVPRPGAPERFRDRFTPLVQAIAGNVYGTSIINVHLTERLVDDWVLEAMFARLRARSDGALAGDLDLVTAQLATHDAFLAEAAAEFADLVPEAASLVRRRLVAHAWPIGADREPAESTALVFADLFGTDRTWADQIDARVDSLPGTAGLRLIHGATAHPGRAAGAPSVRIATAAGRSLASVAAFRKGVPA